MPVDLTTMTDEQLAEAAAVALGKHPAVVFYPNWNPAANIAQAWELVEFCRKAGWGFRLNTIPTGWAAEFQEKEITNYGNVGDSSDFWPRGRSESPAKAITLAALLALREEPT